MIFDLQKASTWKRISAYIFDGILLVISTVGIAFMLSVALKYDSYGTRLEEAYAKYEAEYGILFNITEEQYNGMSEAELQNYVNAYNALVADSDAMHAYQMVINLTLVITTISILLSYIVLEFAIPLWLGNGQTLGKKIFGIGLMRTDGVRIAPPLLFIRTILGKYTIETMIPVLIAIMIYFNTIGVLGILILGLILLLQIALFIATYTNSLLHDVLAKTVAIDIASQMIFNDEQEMIDYKKKVYAEKAARQTY